MANASAIRQLAAHSIGRKMTGQKEQEDWAEKRQREEIGKGNEMTALRFQTGQENGPLAEKWQDRKSKRTREKNEMEEKGIQWQPWDFKQMGVIRLGLPSGFVFMRKSKEFMCNTNKLKDF